MANKPRCSYPSSRYFNRDSKSIADLPLPVDLSREISTLFDLKTRKQERISEYMCRNIRKTKLRALQRLANIDVVPSITRQVTSTDFKTFSENCPITDMSR